MQQVLLVFIGGGLGSLCRYGLSMWMSNTTSLIPYATFAANVLSCLVLGIVIGLSIKNLVGEDLKIMLIMGFCGGFSTFSTFSNETLGLITSGNYSTAFGYIFFSILVCVLCILLGMKIVS